MILLSELLSKVSEKDIMEHYYQCKIIDRKPIYRNMLRDDKEGTCYFNWYRNHYYLVDRARGRDYNFNCFSLVQKIYNCNFVESLFHINKDMNLNLTTDYDSVPLRKKVNKDNKEDNKESTHKRRINYQIKSRKWNENDIQYWSKFNISIETLIKFDVVPAKEFYSDGDDYLNFKLKYKYTKEDPCYVYLFKRKKGLRVKIYRPLNSTLKWQGNITNSDIFGYPQLPSYCSTIYICSSLKDLMCLHEMGLHAVAPQSESTDIPDEIIEELRGRSRRLIILFDNDKTGILQSQKYSLKYNCRYLVLPELNNNKDVAEFVQDIGLSKTKEIIVKSKLKI